METIRESKQNPAGRLGQKGARWLAFSRYFEDGKLRSPDHPKPWPYVPVRPKLSKRRRSQPAPKPKGPAPISTPTVCFNGCGLGFPSRRQAGLHTHACSYRAPEGAD